MLFYVEAETFFFFNIFVRTLSTFTCDDNPSFSSTLIDTMVSLKLANHYFLFNSIHVLIPCGFHHRTMMVDMAVDLGRFILSPFVDSLFFVTLFFKKITLISEMLNFSVT